MKNISILFLFFIAISCNKVSEVSNDKSDEALNISSPCVSSIGNNLTITYDGNTFELWKLGMYHNEILTALDNTITFDDCSVSDTEILRNQVNQIVNSDIKYNVFFGDTNVVANNFFLDNYNYCYIQNSLELKNFLELKFSKVLGELDNYEEISDEELTLLSNFFNQALNSNVKVDLSNYYYQLANIQNKLHNGLFSFSILIIYDYSYCFWQNRFSNGLHTRILPWLAGLALGDAGAALVQTGVWLYDNHPDIEGHEKGRDLARKVGKAASSASTGFLGPISDRLWK